MIIKKETIIKLDKLLGLNYQGFEQDWSIELANPNRITEFIETAYSNHFESSIKYALMELILASFNDRAWDENDKFLWNSIEILLNKDLNLYVDLLKYWAVEDEKEKDQFFRITPFVRDFLQRNY